MGCRPCKMAKAAVACLLEEMRGCSMGKEIAASPEVKVAAADCRTLEQPGLRALVGEETHYAVLVLGKSTQERQTEYLSAERNQ